jgi:F-type H+-transporting ATPase subunit epsilon
MSKLFRVRILAAERPFYEGECSAITIPLEDGEYGILAMHYDIIVAIVPGLLRFTLPDGEQRFAAVGAGMVKVEKGEVLVLADTVERPEEIDENRARRALEAAQEALLQKQSYAEYRLTQSELARAVNRLKVKQREI